MNKRRMKKAYRKHMGEGKPLSGNENAAIFNGRGDFTKRLVKQLDLNNRAWYAESNKLFWYPIKG